MREQSDIIQSAIDNVAFRLSLVYIENHHHLVRMDNVDSDEVRGWRRAARFALEYQPSRQNSLLFLPPKTEQAREQMAEWLARHYLGRVHLPESYWKHTKKPWLRVADAVMKMGPQ